MTQQDSIPMSMEEAERHILEGGLFEVRGVRFRLNPATEVTHEESIRRINRLVAKWPTIPEDRRKQDNVACVFPVARPLLERLIQSGIQKSSG